MAPGACIARSRGPKGSPSSETRAMEISCCNSSRSHAVSFLLLHEVTSLTSTQQPRSVSSCDPSSFIVRQGKTEQLRCSNVTFVRHCHRRWKLERSRGLDSNFRDAFNLRKCSGPFAGRREINCCDGQSSLSGGVEEPIGDAASQNWKILSSPASSQKDGEKITISAPEKMISNSSTVEPFQAPAIKMDSTKSRVGVLITTGHFLLAAGAVVLVDYQILVNDQFAIPFRLTLPFLLSAGVTAVLGYLFVPVLEYFKAVQIFRIEGPTSHKAKTGTPTMGGLFFVPVGVAIAGLFTGFNSIEVEAAMIFTLALAGIGLLDDSLAFWRKHNYGLPGVVKLMMQVAIGISFFFRLASYPHKIKPVVWFPAPFGLLHLGRWYLPLTAFCCAAMSNGVNLTDGLDGLAGGTAAVAFIAMSLAVLPLCPELGVFGTSMAGACFGFLVHNRYKAKVFMGDTGSLALGGALSAMACCTGMFFPLFIASGVFVIETLSVIGQVFYFKLTKKMYGEGRRLFRMSPFHHHLELVGLKEPIIIIMAYSLSIALGLLVAYLVLGKTGIKVLIN